MQQRNIILLITASVVLIGLLGFLFYDFDRRYTYQQADKPEEAVFCTQEAVVCSDGSSVGRTGPNCEFAPCPKEDLIQVESLGAYETVSSPLVVKGKARGFWFFEASFPVQISDAGGNVIAYGIAQAKDDWMTTEFVPFEVTINFTPPASGNGFLIFKKDNPSGLPEHDDELRVPVFFAEKEFETRTINLFYYDYEKDKDESGNAMCGRNGLVSVPREIRITKTPIQDAVRLLIAGGLTEEERAQGIDTEYPLPGFSLVGASLKDGVLTLEFNDSQNRTVGGSCRVGILWFQIEATAKQFAEVKEVRFLPEEIFQP